MILQQTCRIRRVHSWGCFMNDARLSSQAAQQLLSQMKPTKGVRSSHYERIEALHLSNMLMGKDTQQGLAELLKKAR